MLDVVTIDSVYLTIAQFREVGQQIEVFRGEPGRGSGNEFPIELGEDELTAWGVEGLEEGGAKEMIVMTFVLILNEVPTTLYLGKGSENAQADEVVIADRATEEDIANVVVKDESGWGQKLIQQQRTRRERESWER